MAKPPTPAQTARTDKDERAKQSRRLAHSVRELKGKLQAASTGTERDALLAELDQLAKTRRDLDTRAPAKAPAPQSFIAALKQKRDAAASASGRTLQRVRMVQSGAPGSGKKK